MPDLDPDRRLALAYVPARRRAALEALWRLDVALGAVLATGRDPMISRIRLAWWRERLEELDAKPPPAEPVLQALADHVLHTGVTGADLARLDEGWEVLLAPEPLGAAALAAYAEGRGARLFALSARLLGGAETGLAEAGGRVWALADLARHATEPSEIADALGAAGAAAPMARWPRRLRPLGMLASLARRDAARGARLEPHGAPGRMLRMLRHRLTGF